MIASDPAPAGPLAPTRTKPAAVPPGSGPGRATAAADFDAVLEDAGEAAPVEAGGKGRPVAGAVGRARRDALPEGKEVAVDPAAPPADVVAGVVPAVAATSAMAGFAPAVGAGVVEADQPVAAAPPAPGKVAETGAVAAVVAEVAPATDLGKPGPELVSPAAKPVARPAPVVRPSGGPAAAAMSEAPRAEAGKEAEPVPTPALEPARRDNAAASTDRAAPPPLPTASAGPASVAQGLTMQPALDPGWQLAVQPAASPGVAEKREMASAEGVTAAAVTGQVSVAIARSGGSSRKLELRLDPPELGRVEIHLSPSEKGGMQATVVAERAETHALLRRHADVLARELGDAGYADVSLSFATGNDAAGGGRAPAGAPLAGGETFTVAAAADSGALPAATPPPRPNAPAEGGLDIRL